MGEAAFGHLAQAIMVVQQWRKFGFARQQRPALVAFDKGPGILAEAGARQRFKDVEYLLGIFLVLDQLAKMVERLERTKTGCRPVRMDERPLRIAGGGKVMVNFHNGYL